MSYEDAAFVLSWFVGIAILVIAVVSCVIAVERMTK